MKTSPKQPHILAAIMTSLLLAATTLPAQPPAAETKAADDADDKAVELNTLTVTTGSRAPKIVDQIPGAITLITQDDISQQLLLNNDATAVLQATVPGYGPSAQSLQSAGETLRGRVALRLFDGIPMSTPLREGSRSAYFADMSVIGRIEVINGPSASEGVGASGGIINFISRTPTKMGTEADLFYKYGKTAESGSGDWKLGVDYTFKSADIDALVQAGFEDLGLTYDAHGRAIGFHTSGSTADSKSNDFFIKLGHDFGTNNDQRIQLTVSRYELRGKGNYTLVVGDRTTGVTNTVAKIRDPLPVYNDMNAYSLSYTHSQLGGGNLSVQVYRSSEAMGFVSAIDSSKQDPNLAPIGTLVDQSEINSQKHGLRSNWTRDDFFVPGLELSAGIDLVFDKSQQLLAVGNRTWAPPVKYSSVAPYAQIEYKKGPVTLSAGVRHEGGKLDVDSFTTIYTAGRTFVQGGKLTYDKYIPNAGLVVKIPYGFSVFGSTSQGFGLPDVGVALRGISVAGQSVSSLFGQLQAVIVKANEVGMNWRGKKGSFGASYYQTRSRFGSTLTVDPITQDYVLSRLPVKIQGYEMNGEYKFTKELSATALFSHASGVTAVKTDGPTTTSLGLLTMSPDKITSGLNWKFLPVGNLHIGTTTFLSRDLISNNGVENFRGYTLIDVGATYKTKLGTFGLGIENAFNRYYILPNSQFIGFQNYWAGRGRVFSLSDNIKF